MQGQMQKMMLAKVRREYVLTTIDPAVSPELKSEPARSVIVLFGAIFGFVVGMTISLGTHYARKTKAYPD